MVNIELRQGTQNILSYHVAHRDPAMRWRWKNDKWSSVFQMDLIIASFISLLVNSPCLQRAAILNFSLIRLRNFWGNRRLLEVNSNFCFQYNAYFIELPNYMQNTFTGTRQAIRFTSNMATYYCKVRSRCAQLWKELKAKQPRPQF